MPNVVTYCRVSSDEQALKDLSIPAQRKALRRWIEDRDDIEFAETFVDEGQSAYAPADKRPGFCRMIAYAASTRSTTSWSTSSTASRATGKSRSSSSRCCASTGCR